MSILKKQIEELQMKNEKLEKERDAETKKSLQCQSDLRDQQTSLTSALEEKQRIESQFNQQKTTINRLESSKDAAESDASYNIICTIWTICTICAICTICTICTICSRKLKRKLSSKRSQVYRLQSENENLENSEDRCNRDLRYQKSSLTTMKENYNLLINSELYLPWNIF